MNYRGDKAEVTATAGFSGERYSAAGLSVRGGFTATAEGAALHRSGVMGGTRMLVDTGGVADVPVRAEALKPQPTISVKRWSVMSVTITAAVSMWI